ncbi:DUF4157 domain-containing protein [Streptomyces sp. NBC_01142]|uniref:eCIS core domain-containing protein n=1 Tax=Streptomyces sp. NBC_01142 TaxID=2975865 RepID=UPI00224EEC34|nr:DUF4157 domain-containing protein [Streptomyces sp. NBC_01142]MCX4821048.1 DUF4157 domain-containing protein [Streptomyces sp. NBC_01142]
MTVERAVRSSDPTPRGEAHSEAFPDEPATAWASAMGNQAIQALLGPAATGGRPLDPAARAFMEARLGADLSRVRVHTDADAAASATALEARAYTVGQDIVFGPGEYRPAEAAGREVLAHELRHTVQQARGGTAPAGSRESERAAAGAGDGTGVGSGAGIGGTAVGIALLPKRDAATSGSGAEADSLGPIGDAFVDGLTRQVVGRGPHQRLLAAALRGFVAELGHGLTAGDSLDLARAKAALAGMLVPANAKEFERGYLVGLGAGVISPATDLLVLGALAEQLPLIAKNLGLRAWRGADAFAAEAFEILTAIQKFRDGLPDRVRDLQAELKKMSPGELYEFLANAGLQAQTAAGGAAGKAGREAAKGIVGFFTGTDKKKEEETRPPETLEQILTTHTEAEHSGVLSLVTGKFGRAIDSFVTTTPRASAGYSIGHTIGMLVSNGLLAYFTLGVGTALSQLAGKLGQYGRVLGTVGKAVGALGAVVTEVEEAINAVTAVVLRSRAAQAIMAPFLPVLERLLGYLKRLLGLAEREAGTAAAHGVAPLVDEAAAKSAPTPAPAPLAASKPAPKPAPAPKSVPTPTPAPTPTPVSTPKPPGKLLQFKRPVKPPVSELTKAQQAKLGRIPKGTRKAGRIPGPKEPPVPEPVPEAVPQAALIEEPAVIAGTGTDGAVTTAAGRGPDPVRAMADQPPGVKAPKQTATPQNTASGSSTTTAGGAPAKQPGSGSPQFPKGVPQSPTDIALRRLARIRARVGGQAARHPAVVEEQLLVLENMARENPVQAMEHIGKLEERLDELMPTPDADANEPSWHNEQAMHHEPGDHPPEKLDVIEDPETHVPAEDGRRPSAQLGDNLAGIGEHELYGHDWHHIVADRDPRGEIARRILREEGFNPANAAENGVRLPSTTVDPRTVPQGLTRHQVLHTDPYYQELTLYLNQARRNENVAGGLANSKGALAEGVFDHAPRLGGRNESFTDWLLRNRDEFDWIPEDEFEEIVKAMIRRPRKK